MYYVKEYAEYTTDENGDDVCTVTYTISHIAPTNRREERCIIASFETYDEAERYLQSMYRTLYP
jgi:hypothetical protein